MGNMPRDVIELSDDIRSAMPLMQRAIDGCGYNPEVPVAAFRYKNFGVIIHSRDILITHAGDEVRKQVSSLLAEIDLRRK